MAKLIIRLDNKVVREEEIKGQMTIGRDSGDIVLKNPAVSSTHARISLEGNRYLLQDLNSTNGTYVNKGRIASHELGHGDVINIGKFQLEFIDTDHKKSSDDLLMGDAAGMTVMINAEEVMKSLKSKEPKKAKDEKAPAAKLIMAPKSSGASAAIITYKLEKDTTLIGSGENVDIRIKGLTVGNVAAAIRRDKGKYFISFMGGLSKLKVNGKKVSGEVELKKKDKIEIGSNHFHFHV